MQYPLSISHQQLKELAERYSTPLYVYSEAIMQERFAALRNTFTTLDVTICYAMKANANLAVLSVFKALGAGFDIVSEGELRRALKVGADPKSVVYSGVGKTRPEIEFAIKTGIKFFNVESGAELEQIELAAKALNIPARYCFRINPDVRAQTHKYLTTGVKTSKFGIVVPEALALWERFKESKHLDFVGIDCHIGSQITSLEPLENAYNEVLNIVKEFESRGATVKVIDLGGGFGISYSGHYTELDLGAYSQMVQRVFKGLPYQLVIEPGRFLVGEAGTLLTTVTYVKPVATKQFAIVDAGMNDLLRPSLYEAFHHIEVVGSAQSDKKEAIDVVGPVCESGCFFAKDRELPKVAAGDVLAICDAGAYGMVMASTYNVRKLPAEVLVDAKGTAHLVRVRENYEDLWKAELTQSGDVLYNAQSNF